MSKRGSGRVSVFKSCGCDYENLNTFWSWEETEHWERGWVAVTKPQKRQGREGGVPDFNSMTVNGYWRCGLSRHSEGSAKVRDNQLHHLLGQNSSFAAQPLTMKTRHKEDAAQTLLHLEGISVHDETCVGVPAFLYCVAFPCFTLNQLPGNQKVHCRILEKRNQGVRQNLFSKFDFWVWGLW